MAAGVSIMSYRLRPTAISHTLLLLLLAATVRGVAYSSGSSYRSHSLALDPFSDFVCPQQCNCHTINKTSTSPSKYLQCAVGSFGKHLQLPLLEKLNDSRNGYAIFACANDNDLEFRSSTPNSTLWEGAFSGMTGLRILAFNHCHFKTVPGNAFRGLTALDQLSISGASISVLDGDLLNSTPSLTSLQVTNSGLKLLSALCRTGSPLRVLNLTGNAITSFDAAGVRCTGDSEDWNRGPPLKGLETLDLRSNAITTWPSWLGTSLPGLYYLLLGHNRVSNPGPGALSGFSSLTFLDLTNNSINSFSSDFFRGASSGLQTLSLSHNPVGSLPPGLLSGLTSLHLLDLSSMQLDSYVWPELSQLGTLRSLNLSSNNLQSMQADVLRDLRLLEKLDLGRNQINALPAKAFDRNIHLHTLDLSYNKVQTLGDSTLIGATRLKDLYLNNNRLEELTSGCLVGNSELRTIDFSNNFLASLPPGLLSRASNLSTLNFSNNSLVSLQNNMIIIDLKHLVHLNMSHNKLLSLPSGPFPSSLETIDFSFNNATHFSLNDATGSRTVVMLKKVNRTKLIRFAHNRLRSLPSTLFADCKSLRILDLSHNEIVTLEESVFPEDPHLEEVDVSHNHLVSFGTIFYGMKKLRVLNLSWNKLTELTTSQFPLRIENIDLSNNKIFSILKYTFKSLTNLRSVDLRANKLTSIDRLSFQIQYNLLQSPMFSLQFNPLKCDCNSGWLKDWYLGTIKETKTLPSLREGPGGVKCSLDISSKNPYETSRKKLILKIADVKRSAFLCEYKHYCDDDCVCCDYGSCYCSFQCPDKCSCYRGDNFMRVQGVSCSSAGLEEIPETLPEGATELHLDGNSLAELPRHAFIGLNHVQFLYLNNSGVRAVNNHTFKGLKSLHSLYLNNNELTEIFAAAFEGLNSLRELYLHDNHIAFIESRSLLAPPLLSRIDLRLNALSTLALDDLWSMVNRSKEYDQEDTSPRVKRRAENELSLSLSGNPWTCEPAFACGFLGFILNNSQVIVDLQDIQCVPPPPVVDLVIEEDDTKQDGSPRDADKYPAPTPLMNSKSWRKLLDLQTDVCGDGSIKGNSSMYNVTGTRIEPANSDKETYALVAACVVVAFILILLVAVFVNRHLLQVLCYTRFGCRVSKTSDQADAEKRPYDAFICHSNKDQDFVLGDLVPRLENGDKNFKLCVHYRDFPVGACITETIVRSVEASKRTILVLSENFLKSEWCSFEFQTAHVQVLNEKRSRVILILLDDLDPSKVKDSVLRVYLRTQTYLKVGEPFFWEKLMFAMPDVGCRQRAASQRRRQSAGKEMAGKADTADLVTTCLPSSRDLEFLDRGRRMSEQLQQQQMEPQHPFDVQHQQQQLLLQHQQHHQQQQQHQMFLQQQQQMFAQSPLVPFAHPNHNHHHLHHHHHPHHHPNYPPHHYQEQHPHPHNPHVLYYHQHHPHNQGPQQQPLPHTTEDGSVRHEMYEIPMLDPQDSHYQLANSTSPNGNLDFRFMTPVSRGDGRLVGRSSGDGQYPVELPDARIPVMSPHSRSGSTHTNSAFHISDDSSTSGYHNGSGDCCSTCGGHYEEVGPGSSSVVSTPLKMVDHRSAPPPIPLIPKEGFVPVERQVSVNT